MKLVTAIRFRWVILPVGPVILVVLWTCGFSLIEYGIGLLGLVTLSFVVSAWKLGPHMADLGASLLPSLPSHHHTRYAFLAVSIVGATVHPYLLNFYASGTVEEKLAEKDLWVNKVTAYLGTGFGTIVSMGVLVTSAMVLGPQHIQVNSYRTGRADVRPGVRPLGGAAVRALTGNWLFRRGGRMALNAG